MRKNEAGAGIARGDAVKRAFSWALVASRTPVDVLTLFFAFSYLVSAAWLALGLTHPAARLPEAIITVTGFALAVGASVALARRAGALARALLPIAAMIAGVGAFWYASQAYMGLTAYRAGLTVWLSLIPLAAGFGLIHLVVGAVALLLALASPARFPPAPRGPDGAR